MNSHSSAEEYDVNEIIDSKRKLNSYYSQKYRDKIRAYNHGCSTETNTNIITNITHDAKLNDYTDIMHHDLSLNDNMSLSDSSELVDKNNYTPTQSTSGSF